MPDENPTVEVTVSAPDEVEGVVMEVEAAPVVEVPSLIYCVCGTRWINNRNGLKQYHNHVRTTRHGR